MRGFNVVVLGAGGVGKSALIARFINNEFIEHYDPTIEEEYRRTISVNGIDTHLEVIDTSGADQFATINEGYLKPGHGFLLVFSLTQEASLREVDNLRQQIYGMKGGDTGVPIVVVGTKLDLSNEREVHPSAIQQLAARWELPFYESSAKRGWHVEDVFEELVRQMRERYPEGSLNQRKKQRSWNKACTIM